MSCVDFEQSIALYVEDDLSPSERDRTESHLRECSSCRALAEDLRDSQTILKSMRQDIPDAAALTELHERVSFEVGRLGSMSWVERVVFAAFGGGLSRKAALAGIVLAIAGLATLWLMQPSAVPVRPAPAAESKPTPPRVLSARVYEPEPRPGPPAPKRARQRVAKPEKVVAEEQREQVPMKFLTDDPNVIIYWLVDEKGD